MKIDWYHKTIPVNNELCTKLQNGEVELLCGQWIQLAWCDKPSRWVGLTKGGSIWAVHYPYNHAKFLALCKSIDRYEYPWENK